MREAASTMDDETVEIARRYAWDWFALHANQRMEHLNYSLVASAFLVAGYVTAIPLDARIAVAAALAGFVACLVFYRLELRSRELVKLGEDALARIEAALATRTGINELRLVEAANVSHRRFLGTYRGAIRALDFGLAVVFLGGAALALARLA